MTGPYRGFVSVLVVVLLWYVGCSASSLTPDERPNNWAIPIASAGIPNLHQISPTLYRGAQPTVEGISELHKMGIKTIINLRGHHSDDDEVEQAGLKGAFRLVAIPADAWAVSESEVVQFLRVVQDTSSHPIFFHCKHGADRTGAMAAAYRIVNDGWTKKEALNEMKHGGYGFHTMWTHLPQLVEKLNVPKLKAAVSTMPL